MTARFTVRDLPGDPPRVEKRGPAAPLAREAAALRALAGRPGVPALLEEAPGRLVTARLPGAPRPLATAGSSDLRALGRLLRALHDARAEERGGLWTWPAPARDLAEYRRLRAADADAALAGRAEAGLAARADARAPGPPAAPTPFRLLHGDLVEANVVWGPEGPALVDWEFWRPGDPAEDLAYACELNRLPPAAERALLAGYGAPGMGERIDAWRPIVALDAGAWYLRQGMSVEAAPLLARARLLAG